jgi:hypothetical protein
LDLIFFYHCVSNITDKDRLSRGEKTAQVLESSLTSLEKKIDDLLASFEQAERAKVDEANSKGGANSSGAGAKS